MPVSVFVRVISCLLKYVLYYGHIRMHSVRIATFIQLWCIQLIFPGTKNSLCVAMSFRYRGNMCMISVLIWVCPSSLDPNLWGDRVVSLLLACGNVLAFDPRLFDGNRATRSCGNISITARSRPTNSHPGDIPLGGEQTDSGDMPTCRSIRLARPVSYTHLTLPTNREV